MQIRDLENAEKHLLVAILQEKTERLHEMISELQFKQQFVLVENIPQWAEDMKYLQITAKNVESLLEKAKKAF